MSKFAYRPDIDGLRAIAVSMVVLGHAGVIFRGGFVGVDVFFVISGYLISSIIGKQMDSGEFSLSQFWVRRVHRLLPVLVFVTLSTCALGCFLLLPGDLAELGDSVMAQSLLVANLFFWKTSGYFDGVANLKPLLHYWSLAVEEQFYLFFPPLLLLVRSLRGLLVLALASFAGLMALNDTQSSGCFYLVPFRAWELLLGAYLGRAGIETSSSLRKPAAWIGISLILFSSLLIHEGRVSWPGWSTLMPCLGTALVLVSCGTQDTKVARFLSQPRLVRVGLISYSWYLWHWPLMAFWNYWKVDRTPLVVRITLIVSSYLLAELSYRLVEKPLRRPRPGWSARRTLGVALLLQSAVFFSGYLLSSSGGWPSRLPPAVQKLSGEQAPDWADFQVSLAQAGAGEFIQLGDSGPVELWVWGDSHAIALIPALEEVARERGCRIKLACHSGLVPLLSYPAPDVCSLGEKMEVWNQEVLRHWGESAEPPPLLMVCRWSYRPQPQLRAAFSATLNKVRECSGSATILKEVPVYHFDPKKALIRSELFQVASPRGMTRPEYDIQNTALNGALEGLDVSVLDPKELFWGGSENARLTEQGACLYSDDNHLSRAGALFLRPLIEGILETGRQPARED